jgi:hypothetical protein
MLDETEFCNPFKNLKHHRKVVFGDFSDNHKKKHIGENTTHKKDVTTKDKILKMKTGKSWRNKSIVRKSVKISVEKTT